VSVSAFTRPIALGGCRASDEAARLSSRSTIPVHVSKGVAEEPLGEGPLIGSGSSGSSMRRAVGLCEAEARARPSLRAHLRALLHARSWKNQPLRFRAPADRVSLKSMDTRV